MLEPYRKTVYIVVKCIGNAAYVLKITEFGAVRLSGGRLKPKHLTYSTVYVIKQPSVDRVK